MLFLLAIGLSGNSFNEKNLVAHTDLAETVEIKSLSAPFIFFNCQHIISIPLKNN